MTKLPLELKHDIIFEAVFELRFEPNIPNGAVFGVIYPIIMEKFPNLSHIPLPILDLPDAVRNSDPQFKYQPLNRLQGEGLSIGIGPRVICFSVLKPYVGWHKWKPIILDILNKLSDKNVIKYIEKTGLRYLNFIDKDVFPLINVEVKVINSTIKTSATTIRTEINEGEYIKALQLANNASMNENGQIKQGSLIDIDITRMKNIQNNDFKFNLETILEKSHSIAKQFFFDILRDNFLEMLEPVYGDNTNG